MTVWQRILITIGINDLASVASVVVDGSQFGPKFKAAAETAIAANQAFAQAAQTPNE